MRENGRIGELRYELHVEVRREVFQRLSEQIGAKLEADGVTEQEVLDDFAADRRRR